MMERILMKLARPGREHDQQLGVSFRVMTEVDRRATWAM
jgi:hypothetical protein